MAEQAEAGQAERAEQAEVEGGLPDLIEEEEAVGEEDEYETLRRRSRALIANY